MHHITLGVSSRTPLLALIFIGATSSALAQTSRGTVTGLITDPQKASVPAATVDLTNITTNVKRTTQSNEAGLYRIDAVDPGSYTLEVKSTGFRTFAARQFDVGAAQVVTVDATLEVGDVQQVVEVNADAAIIQTEAPVRATNITTRQVDELPLALRNPTMLALTAPGVTSNKFSTPTQTFSVNGGRGRSNNFMIDGTDNNDISVAGQALRIANPGSVAEVNVQTSNYDAEFGRAGGAVVNVVTRSGSNEIHGTAGFVLDSTWDDAISNTLARSPDVQARGRNLPGTEQQFDGTLGGPIFKDRTFYHVSFLERRQFSTSTLEMQTFSAAGRARFNQIFPEGRSRNADLLKRITEGFDATSLFGPIDLGDGRGTVEFGRGQFPYAQKLSQRQWGFRLDQRFSDVDNFSFRLLTDDQDQPAGGENRSFPTFITSSTVKAISPAINYTRVFSPTLTNELRLSYTRYDLQALLDPQNELGRTLPLIVIQGINTTTQFLYGIGAEFPQGRVFNNYTLQNTMSWIRGTHTLRFGLDLMNQRARQAAPFNERGLIQYNATTVGQAYSGLANFVDDFGGAGGQALRSFGNPFYYPSLFRQAYFFQDRWRATPSLTLSLGLRYEYFGTPMNVIFAPAFTGLYNVDPVTLDSPFGKPNKIAADKNNFAPMVGIAWSPSFSEGILGKLFGDRKSSFRMGYGIGYDSFFNNITSNAAAQAPNNVSTTEPSQASAANPRGLAGISGRLPITPSPILPILAQSGIDPNLRNPYYQRWSFTIQRELYQRWLFDVGYVGSKGTRLYATEQLNPLVPAEFRAPIPANLRPGTATQNRMDPLQGSRSTRTNGASSSYHSFQTQLQRRYSSGLQISGAYTWSKAIDNVSELFNYGNTSSLALTSVPVYFGGFTIDRGLSSFDRTHRFVFSYIYELPWMKEQRGVAAHILGGWSLTGLTAFETGYPYTVVNGQDADGLEGNDRPNFNPAGRPGVRARPDSSSPTGYVNPDGIGPDGRVMSVPIDPREARYIGLSANSTLQTRMPSGNLGRNTERAPGIKNWDVTVVKRFRVTERISLQLRSEFFNIFNTPQFGTISVSPFAPAQNAQTIGSSVAGSAAGQFLNEQVADGGGRVIRWQLRLQF
jgi:hypothetical protein